MRRFALGLATSLYATTALAGGLGEMTAEERTLFGEEVRAFLLENPQVLVEAMDELQRRDEVAATERDAQLLKSNAAALFADTDDWVGGNPAGDVTLVEFMDYRCSYCRKAFAEVNELVKSDGNIRYILKEYPILGEGSTMSSQFAIAVRMLHGDDAYKAAHNALMTLRGEPTPDVLARLAGELGHDPAPLMAKMASPEVKAVINSNLELAQTLQISGTPTFVINDTMLRGYVPLTDMRSIVADQRAE